MNIKAFSEQCLIEYCSPTLASLKTANLFRLPCRWECDPEDLQVCWNEQFAAKGLGVVCFQRVTDSALVYVYRKSALEGVLSVKSVQHFLKKYGYHDFSVDAALERLGRRISMSEDFPHEIGIFLGYPLGDVIGFIENDGKNCKCIGNWKVYCNEVEARRNFLRFQKCKEVYRRIWKEGSRSIMQLTVAG